MNLNMIVFSNDFPLKINFPSLAMKSNKRKIFIRLKFKLQLICAFLDKSLSFLFMVTYTFMLVDKRINFHIFLA